MDTSSEEFRAACEARLVAQWPKEKRDEFYLEVLARRGREAQQKLVADVNRERRRLAGDLFG